MSTSSAEYQVRVLPERHELEVELTLRGHVAAGAVRLEIATWVPGAYEFLTIGRDLFDVRAEDADTGAPLEVTREGWQGFRVAGARGAVRVSFKAWAFCTERGEICGIVDHKNAVLLGARYLHAPAHDGRCRVTYVVPDGWKIHHPAGAHHLGGRTWEYPSFAVLVDTPVVAGEFDLITRRLHGVDFHHVFVDRALGFASEVEGFVDDLMKVAAACHDVFGSYPFESYTYVISHDPTASWGLEHDTSTTIGLDPEAYIDAKERARGVRVAAHELFHAWNVRRLRPAPLESPDLTRGSFSDALWVAEGFTRYYEFLLCTRAGIYTPEEFFSNVVRYYAQLKSQPAYERVSAVDASLGAFVNHARYPGSLNDSIDYYDKGMLIAFDLDAVLRREPSGESSLDRAFRAFHEQHAGKPLGYTTADVLAFFGEIDPGLRELVAREATGPAGLSVVHQLERLGFAVALEPVRYLGVVLANGAGPVIQNVADTSPAGRSGLAPGDVIHAVNDFPFSVNALAWCIAREPRVKLAVTRGHRALTFEMPSAERTRIAALTWAGTEEQAQRIRRWLGREDFRPAPGQGFSLDSFENFHGIQTLL
jgi:predicted metalloprotease with PDZ domain